MYNSKGNPNKIRSIIPDSQRADARSAHFRVGYDNTYNSQNHTYAFKQNSQNASFSFSGSSAKGNESMNGPEALAKIASRQKETHITFGGAPSASRTIHGERKTMN